MFAVGNGHVTSGQFGPAKGSWGNDNRLTPSDYWYCLKADPLQLAAPFCSISWSYLIFHYPFNTTSSESFRTKCFFSDDPGITAAADM